MDRFMGARTSTLVLGRPLQVTHDLRGVARSAGDDTYAKLAAGGGRSSKHDDLRELIFVDGCRVGTPATLDLLPSLTLAATLPDDDFEAFQTATAVLLADRVQGGLGQDDLFWHWDAFQEHYLTAQPHIRAALLQGYASAHAEGLVSLMDPPPVSNMTTDTRSTIDLCLEQARSGPQATHADAIGAALWDETVPADIWTRHCVPVLEDRATSQALLRCVRHLYETRPDLDIYPGERLDPVADAPALIPQLPRPLDLP